MAFHDKVVPPMVKFLSGIDPLGKPKEVFAGKQEQIISTHGKAVTQINTIMLQKDLTNEEMNNLSSKPDPAKEAVKQLLKLMSSKEGVQSLIQSRLNSTHP